MDSQAQYEAPAATVHRASVRVRYAETDKAGVAYHGSYLPWFEVGRSEFLRGLGLAYADFERQTGLFLTVWEAQLRYLQPARYDDVIEIETSLGDLRRVRFRLDHVLKRQDSGEVLCRGHIILACVGQDGKPVAIPEDLQKLLRKGQGQEETTAPCRL